MGYQVGTQQGHPVHIMNVYDQRRSLIAQKFRGRNKVFTWIGDAKDPPLYLQWLWSGKGKSITITEGEIDAGSVLQVFDLKWPVVSLPNGCGSAKKALARAYEWLDGYENIVLMFDQDDPGRAAVDEAVELLPPGKVKIAKFPEDCKDANDVLLKHGAGTLIKAFWNAELWRPDGIVAGSEFTRARVQKASSAGFALPYPLLQEKVLGLRKRELTLLTAGSGIGKSTLARELAYHLHQEHGCYIGNVFLEESNEKTVQGYVALHLDNNPLSSQTINGTALSHLSSIEGCGSMTISDHWPQTISYPNCGISLLYAKWTSLCSTISPS
jgi:twinkle protein